MHNPTPRDSDELRESFQALRLAVELLPNHSDDAENPREISETLDLIIRVADRSLRAMDRILAGPSKERGEASLPRDDTE